MKTVASLTLVGALIVCTPVRAQMPSPDGRLQGVPPGAIAVGGGAERQRPAPVASCACTADAGQKLGTGVVWQGAESLSLHDIALLTAPVLWFSADEPLLNGSYPPIPAVIPCDVAPGPGPVVYYQVTRMAYRGHEPLSRQDEDTPAFLDKVESIVLRFFFYYPEDSGVGGHLHDIEGIEQELFLERDGDCRSVRVARVEGLAHGSRWYSNILDVQPDTRFPITVFIEEGKHASAPDRNADGSYMRGYDVTRRINDAWGVRDSLGQGVLLTAGYNAEMTKPRTDPFRLLPPDEPRRCVPQGRSSIGTRPSMGRYELWPASEVSACSVPAAGKFLLEKMNEARFGAAYRPAQFPAGSLKGGLSHIDGPDHLLSVSYRSVAGRAGAAVVLRGLDLREGWLVPRLTVDEASTSLEMLITRSASRWSDAYFSIGTRWQFAAITETRTIDTDTGRQEVTIVLPPNWEGVIEAGVKFRALIPKKMRPFVLGYHFGGFRFGLRGLGFPTIQRWQFIWELGAGAW